MALDFQTLWDAYPTATQDSLFHALGGGWPALIGNSNFRNTCALRLSVGLTAVGNEPPADLGSADGGLKTGAGKRLIVKVATAKKWLERLLGPSTWGTSKAIGSGIDELIPHWKGILLYRVPNGADASGHVDLWNLKTCRVDCHSEFARSATTVELWQLT